MSKTEQNLKDAFAGESQANRKYLAFARKAEEDGMGGIARLFRATAHAETVHALQELHDLGGLGSTTENLQTAIEGETHEYTDMYVRFLNDAKDEGHKAATKTFHWAKTVEEIHANLYKTALQAAEKGQDLKVTGIYVCEVCGNIELGEPPEKCRVCGRSRESFKRID